MMEAISARTKHFTHIDGLPSNIHVNVNSSFYRKILLSSFEVGHYIEHFVTSSFSVIVTS